MSEPTPPTGIGAFQIKRSLGAGTMGEVWQAALKANGQDSYAVKLLNPKVAIALDWAAKFKGEIRDEHFLEYADIGFDAKYQQYVAAPFIEVRPMSRQAFRWERSHEIVDSFVAVLKALQKAHDRNFVHGNIKPSNLLLRKGEGGKSLAVLADWGLTYVYDKEYFTGERFEKVFPYMAPERIRQFIGGGDPKTALSTPAADLYSLAVVLIETLTGTKPFAGCRSVEELVRLKRDKKYMLLHANFPVRHLSVQKLNEFVKKGLAYDVDQRFRTADDMAAALEQCKLAEKKP